MYSALEGVDEVVESFSQSFSPFRLPVEGQEEKPSAESGLGTSTYKPTNDTHRQNKNPQETRNGGMKACTDRLHEQTCTHTERCGKTRSDAVTQISKPCLLSRITSYCTYADEAVQRGTEKHVQPSKAKSRRCLCGYCER